MTMSFHGYKKEGDQSVEAYPHSWAMPSVYGETVYDATPNPDYRPELDVNLSNYNTGMVLRTLGYCLDEDCYWSARIEEFLGRATRWLQTHIGQPSMARDPQEVRGDGGCRMIDCGVRPGYVNDVVRRLVALAQTAKNYGATEIAAS